MNILFFPANKLNVTVCPKYNGHTAIVSANTDRLIDGKYALAEMSAFKHNLQFTSFLHAFGDTTAGENTNYGDTLKAVKATGRISYGLYWRSDMWVNPNTGVQEPIPDYYATAWTAAGANVFANAVTGQVKNSRSPNHGQQLFDISNGAYGYDMTNGMMGASNLSEVLNHTQEQLDHIKEISGINITTGSYTNGAQGGWNVLFPTLAGMRNSDYGHPAKTEENRNIKYDGMTRKDMMMSASTTRSWDAVNANQFTTQTESLEWTKAEIQRTINNQGWFSDFMHWHSLYLVQDYNFFDMFGEALKTAIGTANVWKAGNNEVYEYYTVSNAIEKIGSYIHGDQLFIFARLKDQFIESSTNGISDAIPRISDMTTPISFSLDLTGTSFSYTNMDSDQAETLNYLGSNKWIINVRPVDVYKNGYLLFSLKKSTNMDKRYTSIAPSITIQNNNLIQINQKANIVIWSKPTGSDDSKWDAEYRSKEKSTSFGYSFQTGKDYRIGAINQSRVSSLLVKN